MARSKQIVLIQVKQTLLVFNKKQEKQQNISISDRLTEKFT